jgi:hypothetical protein
MRGLFVAGDIGEKLTTIAFPDSTLKGYIDTARAAGTRLTQKLVKWATGANFQVSVCAENDVAQGRIIAIDPYTDKDGNATYKLTVEWFWYVDAASAKYPANRLIVLPYEGSAPSRGSGVTVYSTTYSSVKDATSLGAGRVVGVDTATSLVAVVC